MYGCYSSSYTMKRLIILTIAFIITIAAIPGCSGTRQIKVDPPLDSTAVRDMVNSRSFVFIPQFVNPIGGRRRDLSSDFEFIVTKDSLISYLPFFGRGYVAPISPSDVDYDFTSKQFSYNVIPARKGWTISIKPTDQQYLRELFFRVFNNGSASLNVTSLDRSSISYDGYVTQRKEKEPTK